LHKNARPIDVSISIAPIFGSGGAINGAVAIYKDVSEKKKLAEGGQFGIWDLDIRNRKLIHCNKWEETLGYEENELDNKLDTWLSLIHSEDLPKVTKRFSRHSQSKEKYVSEFRVRCKNNGYKWVRSKGMN
jgi:hypothetical protein